MALEAQEKERNMIGQELHDNVNQILAGTKLLLSTLLEQPGHTRELLTECMSYLQDAIEENRKIAHILVTPDFEANSLADQIFNLTNKMLVPGKIKVDIDTFSLDEKLLDNHQKLALYRIAQEQCSNIIKYAMAHTVNISLSTIENLFTLTITDDGTGMRTDNKTRGIGLKNIKGRINIYNGIVTVKTAPGKVLH
jgi:signal transduction histidine kinase